MQEIELWNCENPVAFTVNLKGHVHLTRQQWLDATDRYMDSMLHDFKDNNGVVQAYQDAHEADPASPQAQRWAMAVAKATASGLEGLPIHPNIHFEVFTYYTD